MNIKVTKDQHDLLCRHKVAQFVIGSKLYKTETEKSDTDILMIYSDELFENHPIFEAIPCQHQFQYDDLSENTQYIWTSESQFYRNIYSGDSTINVEVAMYYLGFEIEQLRTYNIIKSFLGFAKRDLKYVNTSKDKGNREFHILRGLYTADSLLQGKEPKLDQLAKLQPRENLKSQLISLKKELTNLYQSDKILKYPSFEYNPTVSELGRMLLNAENLREFKYD